MSIYIISQHDPPIKHEIPSSCSHATAAFTLDVYGHVTDQMKEESANRMERFIHIVKGA